MEIYARIAYVSKETVKVIQNVLAVVLYLIICFGFIYYPIYINNLFTPTGLLILIGIILLGFLQFSLYILYFRRFRGKDVKFFNYTLIITFLSLLIFIFALVNLIVFVGYGPNSFVNLLLISITIQ